MKKLPGKRFWMKRLLGVKLFATKHFLKHAFFLVSKVRDRVFGLGFVIRFVD